MPEKLETLNIKGTKQAHPTLPPPKKNPRTLQQYGMPIELYQGLKKIRLAVRKTYASEYDGSPIEGPSQIPQYRIAMMFQGSRQLVTHDVERRQSLGLLNTPHGCGFSTLRKLAFHFRSNCMGYDRGDSFPFDTEPNGF